MGAPAADRVNASTLVEGYVIAVERDGNHLIATRRKNGVLHVTVTGKTRVADDRQARYVIHTDQGDTLPVPGIQKFLLIAAPTSDAPAVDAPAPAPIDPAQLWRDYETAHEFALAGDQDAPARDDMRPRTETFRGRRLKVARGQSCGTIDMFVNGASAGSTSGSSAAAMNRAAEQLRKDVLAADERRVTDPDAYPAVWFHGATELAPAIVAYVRHRAEQDARDRAAIAATTCTDPGHVPSVIGCPVSMLDCNGVPFGADTMTVHEVRETDCMTGFDMAALDFQRALAGQLPDVGTVSTGETPWDHKRVRRVAVWQLPAAGHLVTIVYYDARPAGVERSLVAVLIDGAAVATDLDAVRPSVELCRFLAWTVASAVREREASSPAAALAADAPAEAAGEDADQGDAAAGDVCTGCGEHFDDPHAPGCPQDADPVSLADVPSPAEIAEELIGDQGDAPASAVPTVEGVPAGMPYVATMPQGWPVAPVRIEAKTVAKILRTEFLPAWFPGVKFSVRTDRGSMYVGADISWTDGPASQLVALVADMWRGMFYDGQHESTSYRGAVLYVDADGVATAYDLPGISIGTHRDVSRAAIDKATEFLRGVPTDSIRAHSKYLDPFGRPWFGGSVEDCARWLAEYGVDRDTRDLRGYGPVARDVCPVGQCALAKGHRWPALHRNAYGRAFLALPEQGDGDQGDGGTPTPPGPDDSSAPAGPTFRTWEELAEHIRPTVDAPVDGSQNRIAPLPSPDRQPLFLLTDDDYRPVGFVVREGDRLIGYDTNGRPVFNRKDQSGVDSAAKNAGYRLVTSTWYGVKPYADANAVTRADAPAAAARLAERTPLATGPAAGASPRDLVVVNNGRGALRVHRPGCRDIEREAAGGGTWWPVSSPDVRGVVADIYGNGDFEGFELARWQDSGDVQVLPCVGALPDESDAAAPAPTVEAVDQGAPAAEADVDDAPVIRPELGDSVRVAGWSGVLAYVAAVQQDAVTGWDTDQTLRFPVGKVTEVTTETLTAMRHVAALILESPARGLPEVANPMRAILETPTWTSGKPKPGEGVYALALNDTEGKRLENVELIARTVTKLGCGCYQIEFHRPGLVKDGHRSRVALLTGCHRHDRAVAVPLPTAEELAGAEQAGREAYELNIPAERFPTEDERIAPTFKRLPVGSAVYSALITAYHLGYEAAAERAVKATEYAVTVAEQNAAAGAEIAARNPAAQECADINAAGAASGRAMLAARTAELAEVREIVAGGKPATGDLVGRCGWATTGDSPCSGELEPIDYRHAQAGISNPRPGWNRAHLCTGHGQEARTALTSAGIQVKSASVETTSAEPYPVPAPAVEPAGDQGDDEVDPVARWERLAWSLVNSSEDSPPSDRKAVADEALCRVHGITDPHGIAAARAADERTRAELCTAYWVAYAEVMAERGTFRVLSTEPEPAPAASDQGDDEQPEGWPEFYTLTMAEYAPGLASDEGDDVLTVTHDHENGTVLDGSVMGDGVYEIAKRYGFTFRPSVGIFIMGSRDKFANLRNLGQLGEALREAGHKVAFEINDVWRPAAVRAEARGERVTARVERLAARSARKAGEGDARYEAARSISDGMPFGEPIKIGHHSEGRHRRAFDRIDANYRAAWGAYDYARSLAGRAEGAAANEAAKHDPRAMMRRSERVATDVRKFERELSELTESDAGNRSPYRRRLLLEIERGREEVAFIAAQLGDKATSGEFVAWSKGDFVKGDFANVAGRWCKVIRANAKTVSVENRYGWGGNGTAPYDEVFGRRRDGMQWDAPNGEAWPVADAVKVAKWHEIGRNTNPGDSDGLVRLANHGRALRLVLGLSKDAGTAEVEAYGEPADRLGKRRRALAAWDVYERLTAGETFEQIAATVQPLNDSAPRWVMPAGEPTEVKVSDLHIWDIVVGIYDMGFAGSRPRLIYSMQGPVTGAPETRDRRESGEWTTVEVDGDSHEVKAYRRVLAHVGAGRR